MGDIDTAAARLAIHRWFGSRSQCTCGWSATISESYDGEYREWCEHMAEQVLAALCPVGERVVIGRPTCETCGGRGLLVALSFGPEPEIEDEKPCPSCGGTGARLEVVAVEPPSYMNEAGAIWPERDV